MMGDVNTQAAFGTFRPGFFWRLLFRGTEKGRKVERSKGVAKRLRHFLRGHPRAFDVEQPKEGIRLRLYPAENHCDLTILLSGRHVMSDELDALGARLADAKVFLDVGANVGIASLLARRRMSGDARVIAIEPHPRTRAKLETNLALNDAGNVTVLPFAVGPRAETMEIFPVRAHNAGANTLVPQREPTGEGIAISVRPLTDLLAETGVDRIDVMKIDVEGFEVNALMPFFETAPQSLWPRYLMMEVLFRDNWDVDLVEHLKGLGYTEAHVTRNDVHLVYAEAT